MFYSPVIGRDRLFFALRPPLELARQIIAASAWLGDAVPAPDRLHVTLLILDDVAGIPPALFAALRKIGDAVNAAPFTITLDRLVVAGSWAALRPASVNAPLYDLYGQLARLARSAQVAERVGHEFNPHMTLSYRAAAARDERVRALSWTAAELLLIHSHVGRTRHDVRGRWPLSGTDPQLNLF